MPKYEAEEIGRVYRVKKTNSTVKVILWIVAIVAFLVMISK